MEGGAPASVLIVDDTIENLRLLSSMLGEQGYETRPVTNGRQAIEAATSHPPDLILLDITMPEMSGLEACERLKAIPALADVPVIFLSALTETADKVKAFAAGGVDYVTKPFQVEEVLARVGAHVALRRTRQELRQSLDQLRELEQLRDDLVHMVVHDMRSPLTILLSNLGFLQSEGGLGPQGLEDLGVAMDAAGNLKRMANDLLDVSRLEEGKMPLEKATCDLATLAREVGAALASWDRSRTIEVAAEGRVDATCDGAVVRRVMENFVTNALKHTPTGSRVRLSVAPKGSGVRVTVLDEGSGVPPEARERIFEKFATSGLRNESKYHSAGLGLAFCKLAIAAHGGAIGVEPGPVNGSAFWFELP